MKKILSLFIASALLICSLAAAAHAVRHPTKEEYDNMQNTIDFICDMYLAEAMLCEYDAGYVSYIFVILFDAAEAYPENTEYGENDADHDWPLAVRLTEEEAVSVIKQKYPYIADETLQDKYISIILEYLKDNGFVLSNPGVSNVTYNENAIKGGFKGYKVAGYYAVAKGMVAGVEYYDLKGKESDLKQRTLWGEFQVRF